MNASGGELELLSGLRLVPAPGHTPGMQVVVVETGGRPIVVGGDVATPHRLSHHAGALWASRVPRPSSSSSSQPIASSMLVAERGKWHRGACLIASPDGGGCVRPRVRTTAEPILLARRLTGRL